MNFVVIYLYVSTVLILRINGIEEGNWNLSIDGVAEIRKQTQLQNNHTVKTIRTRHGDLYDCINYYEQPAFNHPLSKNLTFIHQKKQILSHEKARNGNFTMMTPKTGLSGGGCPDGTVPIKRDTYEDFMRVKIAQGNSVIGPMQAKCSAQENTGYSGVSATIAIYNPDVKYSNHYSVAVMKLYIGPDSIEAGWRVDPKLYKDNKTRFYIHTDARNTHCFNTRCPGFVITQKTIPLDSVFDKISIPGGQGYESDLSITNDHATARWTLRIEGRIEIGYWPSYLFEKRGLADKVEWGGEVYRPCGGRYPGMGSGRRLTEDTKFDAYFSNMKVKNGPTTSGRFVDPINLKCGDVPDFYAVKNEGNVGVGLEYLIFYGGPSFENEGAINVKNINLFWFIFILGILAYYVIK